MGWGRLPSHYVYNRRIAGLGDSWPSGCLRGGAGGVATAVVKGLCARLHTLGLYLEGREKPPKGFK